MECRSALYMPASNERVLAKGPVLEIDAVIIDLEDSVAPDAKAIARDQAIKALSTLDYGTRIKTLRINDASTPWFADDVAAAVSVKPHALVLPKVETVDDIERLSGLLDSHDDAAGIQIWAMMESPMAVVNAAQIAASKDLYPRIAAFLIGNNDMARASDMTVQSDRTLLLPWLMTLVGAAKAYQIGILDGVYNDFADMQGFEAECVQGLDMGMDGKTLIHPSQIPVCNTVFTPSAEAVAQAQAIVDTYNLPENSASGVLQINGRMVERLHLAMAEELLERMERLSAKR